MRQRDGPVGQANPIRDLSAAWELLPKSEIWTAPQMVVALHCRDCSLSIEIRSDENILTQEVIRFDPPVPPPCGCRK